LETTPHLPSSTTILPPTQMSVRKKLLLSQSAGGRGITGGVVVIESKINAPYQAAPLAGWQLPEEFATLHRLLEARMRKPGKREFVQVLRLMEAFKLCLPTEIGET
jgi:hypothetical protein